MKNKKNPVGFELIGIKTEQFALLEENFDPNLEVELFTELQFKLDQMKKQIGVFLGFEFKSVNKIFIKILVSCHFQINEESWASFLTPDSPELKVPKGFLAHLAMIATGTVRGVLFAKTEGSSLSKFIIPTLNVAEMITEDARFEMQKQLEN